MSSKLKNFDDKALWEILTCLNQQVYSLNLKHIKSLIYTSMALESELVLVGCAALVWVGLGCYGLVVDLLKIS